MIRALRKVIKITDEYDGEKLRTVKNGAKYWTPMLIVFLTIGTTDVMFAFDSIPAIFGLTKDPFIVFTSNVFALLGLQQLYFLLGELLDKLVYLPLGLSVVLGFIESNSLWRHCTAIRCRSSMAVNRSLGCLKCLHGCLWR